MITEDKILNQLSANISDEREKQKEVYRKAVDFFRCNSKKHLDNILKPYFTDYDNKKDTIIFRELGLTKGIVDNVSLVYGEKPTRAFKNGESDISEKEETYLKELYDSFGNSFFQLHEKLVNACSHCSVLVYWCDESSRVKLRLLTPDYYDVIVDSHDFTKPTAFYYQVETDDDMTNKQKVSSFYYIDKDRISKVLLLQQDNVNVHTQTSMQIEFVPTGNGKSTENVYNKIPIVTTTSEPQIQDFFVDQNANLFVTAEQTMILKDVSSNDTGFYQGFSLLVHTKNIGGANQQSINDKVAISPKTKINIENGMSGAQDSEKLEYITPPTNLQMLNDDLKDTYLQVATIFGLGESDGNVKANASGLSLVVSDDKKNKLINANRSNYIKFENDLFEIIKTVNNYHSKTKINENVKVYPDFKEVVTNIGLQDRIDSEQHDIDNNLTPKYQLLMDRNPELTEEMAIEQVNKATQENSEESATLFEMTNPENEE